MMRTHYDVVIIGSGFGGAITGARLAQAGRSVCILEKGRRWPAERFPRALSEVRDGIWQEGQTHGFIEYKVFSRMDVIQGIGVGGGSLHYFNVNLRAPDEIFARPEWPRAIGRALLDRYYALAEDMLAPQRLVPPAGLELPRRTTAFLDAARKAGRNPELVPIAVHTGPARPHPAGGVMQEPCDYDGGCLLGCQQQAKNSLDVNYLPFGERRFGMELYPLHVVDKLEAVYDGGYRVHFRREDPSTPGQYEPGHVVGRKVIVAAGTLGTNELLLRCRDQHQSLAHLPEALGRRFSGNGDMLFAGALGTSEVVNPGRGPSITAGADFTPPGSRHRIYIEDLGFPDPFMWLLEGTLPSESRAWGLVEAARSYVGAALGRKNPMASRVAFQGGQLFAGTRTQHFLPLLGMGTDAADGVLSVDGDGVLDLQMSPAGSMEMYQQMEDAMRGLAASAGGRFLPSFLFAWPLRRLLTAHPLGGCAMGDDENTSVVNHRGEVHGHPDLYVADGSIVPGPLAVNPSITISALAERIAYWMIHGRELEAGGPEPENR